MVCSSSCLPSVGPHAIVSLLLSARPLCMSGSSRRPPLWGGVSLLPGGPPLCFYFLPPRPSFNNGFPLTHLLSAPPGGATNGVFLHPVRLRNLKRAPQQGVFWPPQTVFLGALAPSLGPSKTQCILSKGNFFLTPRYLFRETLKRSRRKFPPPPCIWPPRGPLTQCPEYPGPLKPGVLPFYPVRIPQGPEDPSNCSKPVLGQ